MPKKLPAAVALARARWANIPKEERSRIARERALRYWASLTFAERKRRTLALAEARKARQKRH